MTPIAQSPLNRRDWAEDTEAEAARTLEVPTAIHDSKDQSGQAILEHESLQPRIAQPVQSTGANTPPNPSPTAKMSERKARRNTTQALSCPEPAAHFQDSPRATSQPIPPVAIKRKLPSPTRNSQPGTDGLKAQKVPTGPRSPTRSPTQPRGGSRGRGFRGRFRGRGRRNPAKVSSTAQQGRVGSSSTAPSQAPPISSSK